MRPSGFVTSCIGAHPIGSSPVVKPGIHEPLYLHAHAVEGGVGMGHVFLNTEALVHDGHAGTGVEVCQSVRHLSDFFAERLV